MTTELALRTRDDLDERMAWSKSMASGTMLPPKYKGNPANLLFACEYADALGIPRINALTSIHVIDGKPSASADLIAGLIRKAGHRLRVSGDDTTATAQIVRADDPDFPFEVTWTLDRAKTAGLADKDVWKKYPSAMLRSRAITEVARMAASDALYGVIYTPEELGSEAAIDGTPVITTALPARTVQAAPREQPQTTMDALRAAVIDVPAVDAEHAEPAAPAVELGLAVDADNIAAAIAATDDPETLRDLWYVVGGMQYGPTRARLREALEAKGEKSKIATNADAIDAEVIA
jgi:hypothetical protein